MKLRLLLCGAALLVVAGCASPQNPFVGSANLMYNYDMVPSPLPDLTPAELERIYPGSSMPYTAMTPTAASLDMSGR
jgi:hypothetical protein